MSSEMGGARAPAPLTLPMASNSTVRDARGGDTSRRSPRKGRSRAPAPDEPGDPAPARPPDGEAGPPEPHVDFYV